MGESHADAESYEESRFRFRIASAVVDPPECNDASWRYLWMGGSYMLFVVPKPKAGQPRKRKPALSIILGIFLPWYG